MKRGFFLKLALAIILGFGLLLACMYAWPPLKSRYYKSKFDSSDKTERLDGLRGLIGVGENGREILVNYCGSENEADFIIRSWTEKQNPAILEDGLCEAARLGYVHAAEFLLDNGCNIEGNEIRRIPLFYAASNGHFAVVKLLVDRGAKIDVMLDGYRSLTPLFTAVDRGYPQIVQYLVEYGADVNSYYYPQLKSEVITSVLDVLNRKERLNRMGGKNYNAIREILIRHGAKTGEELRAMK